MLRGDADDRVAERQGALMPVCTHRPLLSPALQCLGHALCLRAPVGAPPEQRMRTRRSAEALVISVPTRRRSPPAPQGYAPQRLAGRQRRRRHPRTEAPAALQVRFHRH
jgi:hypothetical protein